jgi:6-phosphofructokinase 1
MEHKTIGILNSGGDCAGLNAVIAAIVRAGTPYGYRFIGFERGWEGVLTPVSYRHLDLEAVRGISHLGGTILYTANRGRFGAKVGSGEHQTIDPSILREAKKNLEKLHVDGLIVIGGDGTLSGAAQLSKLGVRIIGVPKTIDNDLSNTDKTFGFSTAVSIAAEAMDKITTTATSHGRVFFVECMGRTAGWITLYAGLAAHTNAILLPEFPFDLKDFLRFLDKRIATRKSAIIAVAEGLSLQLAALVQGKSREEFRLAGASNKLMHIIESAYPGKYEMRNTILGHIQRGGSPNSQDRILAKRYGVAAFEAFHKGRTHHMVALKNGVMKAVPLTTATGHIKSVTKLDPVYLTAKKLGIYLN